MAPSYRSSRNVRSLSSGLGTVKEEGQREVEATSKNNESRPPSAWERRRRRLQKKKVDANERKNNAPEAPALDPYESDPGESYREHCLKFKGVGTKSCLGIPKFLLTNASSSNKTNHTRSGEESTVLTAPPSPLASDMGDLFGAVPASLPANLTRVRYSLRSSVTDGSEKQPVGPSVMDRRDLRPNNVHLNVSHWSDEGGRPYMEDRYVIICFCCMCVLPLLLLLRLTHLLAFFSLSQSHFLTATPLKTWTPFKSKSAPSTSNRIPKTSKSPTAPAAPTVSPCR